MKKKSAAAMAMAATAGMSLQNYSLSDSELSSSTSSISSRSRALYYTGNPKVAFLFLVRRNLPLDFLWGNFFENADPGNFSIYVHSEPGFVFDESTTRSTFFYNRQLTNSIKEMYLIELLCKDFVGCICVPLYNFSFIYNYLMASPRSFVDRDVQRWKPKLQKQHNCIPDEHYVQTLLAIHGLEGELERRTITYTEWNESVTNMEKKGWHPITFSYADAGPVQIKRIKDIRNVYYESEYRTEWCRNNSTLAPCFLIARKFSGGAAMRLLSEGIVSPFDASSMMNLTP
uniref:Core-2/I-branching beta-1,6-N-acetylglucosaminyltransferase family protein n=1 Tax=Solanum lycopersicum TaxID=4081 RepID=A0A3Q7F598_SOLLC